MYYARTYAEPFISSVLIRHAPKSYNMQGKNFDSWTEFGIYADELLRLVDSWKKVSRERQTLRDRLKAMETINDIVDDGIIARTRAGVEHCTASMDRIEDQLEAHLAEYGFGLKEVAQ